MKTSHPIDLTDRFRRFIAEKAALENDPMALEDELPELYGQWLERYDEELGCAPGAYFDDLAADDLVDVLIAYMNQGMVVPDVLLDKIVDEKPSQSLLQLLKGEKGHFHSADQLLKARVLAVDLLNQLGCAQALETYVQLLLEAKDDALLHAVAQAVGALGKEALPRLKDALRKAQEPALAILLDIVSTMDAGEDVYSLVKEAFLRQSGQVALYAAMLTRFPAEKAIPVLKQALDQPVGYYDYLALRDALEALGEFVADERDFSGDPEYEKLKIY